MEVFENNNIRITIQKIGDFYQIGPLWHKFEKNWRFSSNGISFLIKKKLIRFNNYKIINENNLSPNLILIDNERKIQIEISFKEKISDELIGIKVISERKEIKNFIIILNVNFDKENNLDYIALSGNIYKNVKKQEKINLEVNRIGAFSGVWTVSSKSSSIGMISLSKSNLKSFKFEKNNENTQISAKIKLLKSNKIDLFLGNKDYIEPIRLKVLHLEKIEPLKYTKKNYKELALKAFYALKNFFSIPTSNGYIPANFIHYPIRKKDKIQKSPTCSYGNCFSLGALYGTSALFLWTKDLSIKEALIDFLNPVIYGAQIKEGSVKGAFYDTYFDNIKKWNTGRVQFKDGGFSDWCPFKDKDKKIGQISGINIIELLNGFKKDFLLRKSEFLIFLIWANRLARMMIPYMKKKISKPVIFPAYAGQFSYFLLQILNESENNQNFLGDIEQRLMNTLELAAQFLIKTQKKNNIWDHELYIDGEVFWDKETLACIFPATFLIWWGKKTNNDTFNNRGLKALEKCNSLQDKNEYFGVYFETNLSINQADLVTALACIKCYCKLFELLKDDQYLSRARKAAWHIISTIWSNIYDKKGKNITGGLLVTTYKGMGFPVIGGSELCQCFEVFCEISKFDSQFLIIAKALLGFCLNYLIRGGKKSLGIFEIIFGYSDNWSTSYSADFAAYASGPFIRGLYLFNSLINNQF